jgi:GDPmannose 4,6-dehydratase
MRNSPPDYLLVLPWHFKSEIIKREDKFLTDGGQFIFPLPTFDIVSKYDKVLITGCDGMIATHLYKTLSNNSLYGITKKNTINNNILKYEFDITNNKQLEDCLISIKPDKVIHLAGISSSRYAYENPIETLHINGLVVANICDIIYRYNLNCKLFNASSSEMYKGHIDYEIKEDDTHQYHLHPYSIAKTMGYNMVKFYRETHKLKLSNGILFTVESNLKNSEFLLNKVSKHIKLLPTDKKPLVVNSLDSYRIIMHADDAVSAIIRILEQDNGADYIICGNDNVSILDIVIKMYKKSGINIIRVGNELIDKDTGDVIIIIQQSKVGYDTIPINIRGTPQKLYDLGWKQKYNTEDILKDILL